MKRVIKTGLPLIIFLALAVFLWQGLSLNPKEVPSTMIGKQVPTFHLPSIDHASHIFSHEDLIGNVTIVNVWGSWCIACRQEHAVLMELSRQGIPIYSINYRDKLPAARKWLKNYGDPYVQVGFDPYGNISRLWGVYGAPESYIVDSKGIIRYKHIGPISPTQWREKLLPLLTSLRKERLI